MVVNVLFSAENPIFYDRRLQEKKEQTEEI